MLRYDRRGHGKSGVPKGPYSMEMLGRDAIAVLDGLGIKKANWLGLSMGGMEGMWLGANAADRFDKIILSNCTAPLCRQDALGRPHEIVRDKAGSVVSDRRHGDQCAGSRKDFQSAHPDVSVSA